MSVNKGGPQARGEPSVYGVLDVPLLGLSVGAKIRRSHLVLEEGHCPAPVDARKGLLHGWDWSSPVDHLAF